MNLGMSAVSDTLTPDLAREVRGLRRGFLERMDPYRPDLQRYCRGLTGSPWDAEDLLQETLLRAFSKLAEVHWEIAHPRAWLFRVATNLWIDQQRKRAPLALPETFDPAADEPPPPGDEVRDALEALAQHLPVQERVAVLLKDVFGCSLAETAAALRTTPGAIKAALHRGRGKLAELRRIEAEGAGAARAGPALPTQLLDAFVDAFNARDMDRLCALFREDVEAEVVGMVQEYGRDQLRRGSLHHTLFDEEGQPLAEVREHRGRQLVILWYTKPERKPARAVEDVLCFEALEGGLSALRYYYFCPEVLAEVTHALGLPLRTNGYRYAIPHQEGEA
jgi:RNA polymerase sigma-70 factor, ECF subfamily